MSQHSSSIPTRAKRSARRKSGSSRETSTLASASLVLGLLSFFVGCATGFFGIVIGAASLIEITRGQKKTRGLGLAIAGMALSMLGSITSTVVVLPVFLEMRDGMADDLAFANINQLGTGCLNYEVAMGQLPVDSADGRLLNLSWRVAILPYIGESNLYQQFDQNEPWNGPNNIQLLEKMPSVFARSGIKLEPGKTVFKRPIGNGALFPRQVDNVRTQKKRSEDIRDKARFTILLLETNPEDAVEWTRPDTDYFFDPDDPFKGLGKASSSGIVTVLLGDNTVRQIDPKTVSTETMKALFTEGGGEDLTGFRN